MSAKSGWKKIFVDKASDIIDAGDLDPVSAALLTPEARPDQFIQDLAEARQWPDAVKVMTRSLPAREAVWWACVCARQMEALSGDEGEISALEAAEKWVFKPNDEIRRDAFELAQTSASQSAGALAAMSVGLSGGTIPLLDDQYAEIDKGAFAQTVDATVMISALEKKGDELHQRFAEFLKRGEDIACGGNGQIKV